MSETAITIGLLALVAVIGLWVGHWKIKGVGLGIGGVLFGGIIVAHFTTQYGIQLDSHTLHFVQEFGLILFVYTIGIQVGPGFFFLFAKIRTETKWLCDFNCCAWLACDHYYLQNHRHSA